MREPRNRYRLPLMKESFRIVDDGDFDRDAPLRTYLRAANFEIADLEPGVPVIAHLAHRTQTSLVAVSTPAASAHWHRDEVSRGRALMVFARKGELEVFSSSPVIRRGKSALIIPPGSAPTEIRATGPQNELIYISSAAQVLPSLALDLQENIRAPQVPWRTLAPLYGFLHTLCVTPPPLATEPDLLADATDSIVEGLARTALWDIAPVDDLLSRAQAFIEQNHSDPRLSSASLGTQLRTSQRTLQATFASAGLTVSGEIRRTRSEAATRLLRTHPKFSQAQIAQLSGFSSVSSLYRALQASSAHST
ncbi:helix-turn-helix domain-containing protein [Microbacterium sp. NPDC076768]|uniref:helix-turn-helix domain-containing protein n=1 Tax=Microbacterium sp. NPDC076768 TaxID=3154858 RepID=UPI00342ED6BC